MSGLQNKLDNPQWFQSFKKDVFSQHGEDGIIEKIFEVIGATNHVAVECGALNGIHDSCTRNLVLNGGWRALMIEGDKTPFEQLVNNYQDFPAARCINRFISFEGGDTIDSIFKEYDLPLKPDLFVLDIDGNEYHIWNSMLHYQPRVMVVEFNQTIPNEVEFVQPRDMSVQQGSSLAALNALAKLKGYRLVAVTDINAFFVLETDLKDFSELKGELSAIRPNNPFETKLYQLYDGTLKISGYQELIWHKKLIDENRLQVLSKAERIFPNGINSNKLVRWIKYQARKSFVYPLLKTLRRNPIMRKILK